MSDIVNRLECRYPVGPIQANGEPEFGWRDFAGSKHEVTLPTAIMKEAASEIRQLRLALQGMVDWYEDDNGAGFCECDKSVDLVCRACIARGLLAPDCARQSALSPEPPDAEGKVEQ